MYRPHIKNVVICAMFAALCCVSTLVVQVPSPLGGYFNLGDCFVLTGAFLLGGKRGALAGGIGSMLADVFAGYAPYVPGTFIIKSLMALVTGLLFAILSRKLSPFISRLIAALFGECLMVLGYLAYEAWCLGYGEGAMVGIFANLTQGMVGVILSLVLCTLLLQIPGITTHLSVRKE